MHASTRRNFLLSASAFVGLAACSKKQSDINPEMLQRAKALIARQPSLDLHAHPGKTFVRDAKNLKPIMRAFTVGGGFEKRVTEDMRAGGMTAAVFSAVADFQVLDASDGGIVSHREFEPGEALLSYQTQIAHLNALFTDGVATPILTPADIIKTHQDGGAGAMLGVEGGDFLEGSAERVADAYRDGVRCITLMHYHNNELGDIMTGDPVHNGLTLAGVGVVKAMNSNKIMIDVAHAAESVAFNILENSDRPVICSHTHIKTESFDFPRFISLDLAKEIAASGGLVGAWPAGIGISDLNGYVDRVYELVDAVGIDHVSIGTDMDANYKPVWDNYRQFPDVVALMLERGMAEDEAAKIIGINGMRVFEAVSV